MLCCFLGFSQEAEDGNTFLVIPRIEANPYVALSSDGYSGFDLSNSSIYTLFEGGIGSSSFSYSFAGHWLSATPADLYSEILRTDKTSWLDWANITYAPSNFYFTLGKDVLSLGSLEEDEYDYDQHFNLCSTLWNYLQVYQWAAKAGWANDDETTDISFQAATSPYGAKPFNSNLYTYSLLLRGEYGIFSTLTSLNAFGYDKGSYVGAIFTGNKVTLGDIDLGLDLAFRGYDFDFNESSAVAFATWTPSDKLSLTAKCGVENIKSNTADVFGYNPMLDGEDPYDYYVPASLAIAKLTAKNYVFGGLNLNYYPVDDLRIHAVVAANNWAKSLSLNIGATYYFDLTRFSK